ncbi:MAG: c-type cytochrome [Gemmatirosa sp.]|nr:c-type cytochrome [Gemmatirosa sp.]
MTRRSVVLPLAAVVLLGGCRKPATMSAAAAPAPMPASAPAAAVAAAPATPPARTADTVDGKTVTPVLAPDVALTRFRLADGYRIELVAAEPLVQDPIAIDFDADGRMYVVEMRGYMPNLEGKGEDQPVGRIVVLEDTDDDGKMDKKTVFLDGLVMPRAVRVLEHGVLVATTPNLWIARDTTGDLVADTKTLVRSDYGTLQSNPEHNANTPLWGIDNWLHNANYEGELRLKADGTFEYRKTPSLGQWGVTMDDVGRYYRNSNEDPLHADVVDEHYAARDASPPNQRGAYEALTRNIPVWPGHKTPAVNRGYREETLRTADSTLAHYTSAGSPTVYTGDRLPAELRGNVFVTEPAGNLVGRFIVSDAPNGLLAGRTAYDHAEFLTSTDERFRPVNLATAPDGTLYVVDMYRGIIQHRTYITGYLEQKIKERGMEQPIGLGRIYRIVHTTTRRGERPRLGSATPAQLVATLSHPNGWWRMTAQRLLVERHLTAAAPALRDLLHTSTDARARLHALWTLDGLGEADAATVQGALGDASPDVRAAAVRVAEPRLAAGDAATEAAVMRLTSDDAPVVRRQLAASLGELPASRREAALAQVVARHGDDPLVADLVVSGLAGRQAAFLDRVLAGTGTPNATVQALAASVMRTRDPAAVQRLLAHVGDARRARWQQVALLAGANVRGRRRGPPSDASPAEVGGGGPPAGAMTALALTARPAALIAASTSADSAIAGPARDIAASLTWPGKAAAEGPKVAPLTPAEQQRFAAGRTQYAGSCQGCHQAGGTGLPGVAKPLVGSKWALGTPQRLVRIVLHGKEGDMLMPPVGASLTDEQIANVLTYVRRSWGNAASAIDPATVKEIRGATMGRSKAWTEAELAKVSR